MSLPEKNQINYAPQVIALMLLIGIGYSIIRYHILGPVPWKDFPLYIFNKGISFAAILLLVLNFMVGPLKNLRGEGV